MNKITDINTKQHWFRGYKDYWIGNGSMILVYSIIYGATEENELGMLLGILISLIMTPIVFSLISGIIFLIAWIFKRNFTLKRFLTILTVVLVISLLSKLIVLIRFS
ncbi:hypothetical protein [Marivirga sp.]|uniref:hypothetical protein n=1 Tax=Marivirga sp. TaxID=2018662 RepID=UPI003DA71666